MYYIDSGSVLAIMYCIMGCLVHAIMVSAIKDKADQEKEEPPKGVFLAAFLICLFAWWVMLPMMVIAFLKGLFSR